jgi:hypothetical protein
MSKHNHGVAQGSGFSIVMFKTSPASSSWTCLLVTQTLNVCKV